MSPLDRARRKAYRRLLPLCFICYVIAYVDRANVAIAKLTMTRDLAGFDNAVIGFGAGVFFIGYFLLEIPGTLIIERWSARKWLARIMVTWGVMAALTAAVSAPWHFYLVRFLLGLAEAGFFPGIIVYLTHWFPARDRAQALAYFLVATPIAQIISPKISSAILVIGTDETLPTGLVIHHPEVWGLDGWQWVYIVWGLPAIALGILVFFALTDHPRQAAWLSEDEREALQAEIDSEQSRVAATRLTLIDALRQPKVLLLALAYFLVVTGNYGIEFFLPSILERWYGLKLATLTWLVMLPPGLALVGQLVFGWSSDRTRERLWHTVVPMVGAGADHHLLHDRGRRSEGLSAVVLDAAEHLSGRQRGCWQHRPDQLDRKSWRVSRAIPRRQRRGDDRIVRERTALSRGFFGTRGAHRVPSRHRPA